MATIRERANSDGTPSYQVIVRLKGFPAQRATFTRKTDAKRWAQDTESAIRDGRHFRTNEAKRHTLAELIDRYVEDVLPTKPRSVEKQTAQLEWWKTRLGAYTLADVTPALITECRDELLRGVTYKGTKRGPATVVRYLAALSHALSIAVREWGWLDDSPMRKITRPKEPRGRVRFLDDDERGRLLAACKESKAPHLYPLVVLALSTGARHGELISLTWKQIDLPRGRITLEETKNGERRTLHLTGHALEVVTDMSKVRRIDSNLLFPHAKDGNRPWDSREAFEGAVKRAKISDFHFHDLRHCAASYLAMNGASLAEIAEVLGHKTLAMVKRYAHLSDGHTSRVVASMNEKIFGIGK